MALRTSHDGLPAQQPFDGVGIHQAGSQGAAGEVAGEQVGELQAIEGCVGGAPRGWARTVSGRPDSTVEAHHPFSQVATSSMSFQHKGLDVTIILKSYVLAGSG